LDRGRPMNLDEYLRTADPARRQEDARYSLVRPLHRTDGRTISRDLWAYDAGTPSRRHRMVAGLLRTHALFMATYWPVLASWLVLAVLPAHAEAERSVLTFYYDTSRTGWNNREVSLTPSNVGGSGFGWLLPSVNLDEQVDAQPLLAHAVSATSEVLYTATENNTVYAIDPTTGNILSARNLGTPVPMSVLPGKCINNSR